MNSLCGNRASLYESLLNIQQSLECQNPNFQCQIMVSRLSRDSLIGNLTFDI